MKGYTTMYIRHANMRAFSRSTGMEESKNLIQSKNQMKHVTEKYS